MESVYLDNAATTPLAEEVREELLRVLQEDWGNPSSRHRRGVAAREALDRARRQVARALAAQPELVYFTSGGTEANNLALLGAAHGPATDGASIWIGPTEHASVRECAAALERGGFEVRRGRLDAAGALDLEQLEESLDAGTRLVAQMHVSNEFGSLYPLAQVATLVRARSPRARVHVDAVQSFGKLPVTLTELGADSLSISGHKIHGPQGIGALVLARPLDLEPQLHGGGQERGLRSGTENLAGAVALGRAVELAESSRVATFEHLRSLRRQFLAGLERHPEITCLSPGPTEAQQPGILSLLVPGAPAEVWLHHLDARGVVVGLGSACQANKKDVSPVLLAAGLSPEDARRVLRLSFSRETRPQDVERAWVALGEVAQELGKL